MDIRKPKKPCLITVWAVVYMKLIEGELVVLNGQRYDFKSFRSGICIEGYHSLTKSLRKLYIDSYSNYFKIKLGIDTDPAESYFQ